MWRQAIVALCLVWQWSLSSPPVSPMLWEGLIIIDFFLSSHYRSSRGRCWWRSQGWRTGRPASQPTSRSPGCRLMYDKCAFCCTLTSINDHYVNSSVMDVGGHLKCGAAIVHLSVFMLSVSKISQKARHVWGLCLLHWSHVGPVFQRIA